MIFFLVDADYWLYFDKEVYNLITKWHHIINVILFSLI